MRIVRKIILALAFGLIGATILALVGFIIYLIFMFYHVVARH